MNIFAHDTDRRIYLKLIKERAEEHSMRFVAYCLMDNHVHFIVIPQREDDLRAVFGEAHRRYTKYINSRVDARGYLFQGRFYSCPLDKAHLLFAARYVERNPVRAGMCDAAEDYSWSSARFNLDLTMNNPLIVEKHEIIANASKWSDWLKSDPKEIDTLRKHFRSGRPLGNESFLKTAEIKTGRNLTPNKPGPKIKGT